jgi:asparagine synthase (glutamine-hydrolysing)
LEYGGSYGGAYLLRRGLFMPWELPELLEGEMAREGWCELQPLLQLERTVEGIEESRLKVCALEISWYLRNQLLRDTDWAGMAHSLEIRAPLVDLELLRTVVSMGRGKAWPTKRDLAAAPRTGLPAEVLNRSKSGFVVPVQQWTGGGSRANGERGLRGWAKTVYGRFVNP